MNFKIKNYLPIIIFVILAFSSQAFAQDKTNSDTTKSKMKKMGCCKNMSHSDHEMKSKEIYLNEQDKIDLEKIDKNKDGKVFIDGMCKDVVKDEPGDCPKCGMKLKEVSLDEAKKFIENDNMNTQTQMEKMDCSKKMEHADHEMKSGKNEMNKQEKIDLEKIDMNKDGKVFIDGMCKDVVKDEPGNCPKCGMKLKEVTFEEAKKFIEKDDTNTQTQMKKMDCSKKMEHADHEMKSGKNEMNKQEKIDLEKIDKNKDGKVFQCPMCADQIADEPGKCPKCDMNFEEVSIEEAQKAMNKKSHDMMDHSKMDGHKMDHSKMMNHDMRPADHDKMDMKKDNIVRQGEIDLTAIDKNGDQKVFQDQMDWNVISDDADECPLCGMKLKEVTLEKAKENLIKHGYKVKD